MKALKCVLVLFSFVGLMLVGCSDQSQSPVSPTDQISLEKKTIHYFTIKDFPVPPPYPYVIDPGVKKYLPKEVRELWEDGLGIAGGDPKGNSRTS